MNNDVFERAEIGNLTFKNRILFAPMVTVLAGFNYEVTNNMLNYYSKISKSGVGGVIVESTIINDFDETMKLNELKISSYRYLPGLTMLAEVIQKNGARPIIQLNSHNLYSPLISVGEIKNIIKDFGSAALLAKEAGFKGVEIHSCHNNFNQNILSPATNDRNDEYGGSINKNARYMCEVIREIKTKTGNEYPVIIRHNGSDFYHNGITLDMAIEYAELFAEAGADALHITGGLTDKNCDKVTIPGTEKSTGWMIEEITSKIKEYVKIPVIGVNRIDSIKTAQKYIQNNMVDFVAIGRGLLADPEMIHENRQTKCKYCNYCMQRVLKNKPIKCSINEEVGKIYEGF